MKKLVLVVLLLGAGITTFAFDSGLAGFSVSVKEVKNPYKIFSFFVMPGEEIVFSSEGPLTYSGQSLASPQVNKTKMILKASSKQGEIQTVNIRDEKGREMKINLLVVTPLAEKQGEYLGKYRVGNYPSKPLNASGAYKNPPGLFKVTPENINLQLTPHFTVRQFLCKQESGYPKYVIARELLLLKLEYLLKKVNDKGYNIDTFGFISGYRTPFYNKLIKNVQYSQHVYGAAADIMIDANKDGKMDDLNKDGVVNEADVRIFYNLVDQEYDKSNYLPFRGGLGFYRKNSVHNGFIHVDVRGSKARW